MMVEIAYATSAVRVICGMEAFASRFYGPSSRNARVLAAI